MSVSGIPSADTDPGTLLWQGSVTLPPGRAPGQFRILVAERQLLLSDAVTFYSWIETTDPDHPDRHAAVATTRHATYNPGSGRLVFAETIPV